MGVSIRQYAKLRGVSDAAVRKAIKAGRISKEPDGTVDPAKADAAWERNTNPAQQREPPASQVANPNANPGYAPPANPPQRFASQTPPSPPLKQGAPDYQTSRAIREAYSARLVKLDFEERSEQLVSSDEVKVSAFNLARRVRDRLFTIPHRLSSVLASENDAGVIEERLDQELRKALEELKHE
ncbi:conserved hypothetical protein [Magnetococcus marinus MC-1]|uniref:Uncharacterized protein n=1 Tax=Magnetococcus marinus (strain ATCC BAA-1437 / JCM 17883 / MC-1) TaxID=156889 RepID=A0LBH6_MAGMM|nr:hypothetical protein [Magnetococcus marinus]ABK45319.1 conserved hypothetical protein [Magnetococcus marinus MC-1]